LPILNSSVTEWPFAHILATISCSLAGIGAYMWTKLGLIQEGMPTQKYELMMSWLKLHLIFNWIMKFLDRITSIEHAHSRLHTKAHESALLLITLMAFSLILVSVYTASFKSMINFYTIHIFIMIDEWDCAVITKSSWWNQKCTFLNMSLEFVLISLKRAQSQHIPQVLRLKNSLSVLQTNKGRNSLLEYSAISGHFLCRLSSRSVILLW